MHNKKTRRLHKGFTLIELLIVVAILTILSGVAYIGIQRTLTPARNVRVEADLVAIAASLENYKTANNTYPIPTTGEDKNLNCYYLDTAYAHDCATADFIQAQIDNTLLPKRYLQAVPTDPRTNARYAYGVTANGQYYQIAGIIENEDGTYTAKVTGDLHFTYPLKSLIRSFNGPDFVMDGEGYLPYSPDHLAITATLADITGTVTIDSQPPVTNDSTEEERTVKPGSVINTAPASSAVLYFSDGSVTYLDPDTTLRLLPNTQVDKNDKDGIITKIRLKLLQGKIWSKVARLAQKSEFNIETTSAIAGVRGTEFGIEATGNKVIVFSGIVVARMKDSNELDIYAGTDQYFVFDNTSVYFTNVTNQEAIGDGIDFREFDIGSSSASTGTITSSVLTDLKSNYYQTPYSNTHQPRINEINVINNVLSLQLIQTATNSPFDFPEPNKVIAFDENGNDIATWTASDFTIDPIGGTIDINIPVAGSFFTAPANLGKEITFAFEDESGNLTAKTSPPIIIQSNTKLTYTMLYGDGLVVNSVQSATCGDGTMQTGEQCDDGDNIDYNVCSNTCMLTNNLLYADYGGTTPSAMADFALGIAVPDGTSSNYNVTSAGLKITPASGNYLAYEAAGNMPATGSLEIGLSKLDLVNAPYSYLFEAVDDNGKHVAVYKDSSNWLWFKVGNAACAITNINAGLSNLSSGLKVTTEWSVSSINFDVTDENNLLLSSFSSKTCTGSPPTLSFNTTTAMMYVGSRENGDVSTEITTLGDPLQYIGFIKFIRISQ